MLAEKQKSSHWKMLAVVATVLAIYFYVTRTKTIGTVDASGDGMTVNGA